MAEGAPTIDVLAGRKANEILARGVPAAPDNALTEKLGQIIADFEARYVTD